MSGVNKRGKTKEEKKAFYRKPLALLNSGVVFLAFKFLLFTIVSKLILT